jgi:hypothetical protein
MSNAWETTTDDVRMALIRMGYVDDQFSDDEIEDILDRLDTDAIERAALRGDEMSEQIDCANFEIENQIFNMEI